MPIIKETRIDGEVHGFGSLPGATHREWYGTTNMVTLNHHRYRHPPHFRSGGPWLLNRTEHKIGSADVNKTNAAGTNLLYRGTAVCPHSNAAPNVSASILSDDDMDAAGATAMSRVLPTNPNAQLATLLGETLREGVPSALGLQSMKARTAKAKGAGGEYLNIEFGWKPLLAEVQALADSTKRSGEIWRNHLQGANKDIHRSYDSPEVTTVQVYPFNQAGFPTQSAMIWTGATTITHTTKQWYEFAFRYVIPMGADFKSQMERTLAEANKLYGVGITPDVLWNLSPWSWAADWFGNTGDVLANMSALQSDTLVLLYGYAMRSDIVETRSVGTHTVNGRTYHSSNTMTHTIKQRRPANPYGFGVAGQALSVSQKAIVAALAAARTGKYQG